MARAPRSGVGCGRAGRRFWCLEDAEGACGKGPDLLPSGKRGNSTRVLLRRRGGGRRVTAIRVRGDEEVVGARRTSGHRAGGVGCLRDSADRGRAPARDEDVPARSFRPFEIVTINYAVIVEI